MPSLQLFGPPALQRPDGALPFRREQRFRLLAYVAVQQRPVDRDHLAFVFWPDLPNDIARRNLRKTWFNLRRLDGFDAAASGLQADGGRLAWVMDSDLARWQACRAAGDLLGAVQACAGPLLQGLDGGSTEFQRWLDMERDRLAREYRDTVLALLPRLGPGHGAQVLAWLQRLLDHDPLDEAAMRAQVHWLSAEGRLGAARQVHERWRQRLHEDLGIDAEPGLQDLLAPAARTAAAPAPAAWQGPVFLSSFIGRRDELARLQSLLAGGTRLLTLLGPPGCGKTRLAAQLFGSALLPQVSRRVFVELDRLPAGGGGGEFAFQIASRLGWTLAEGEHALERLAEQLGREPTLLVLDNLEHRLDDLPALGALLRTPALTVLATSRTRLGLDGEVAFELPGLSRVPTRASDDALELFEARSGQRLQGPAREAARRLCELLEGQPLAIELAAHRSRTMSPTVLLDRIAADFDLLSSEGADRPARQRSLRAAFETHFQLLPAALQQTLTRLAVLRADFGRDAARAIAGCGDAALAALVNHSLLRLDPASDRLRWHPFVRSFALDRLALEPAELAAMQQRHAACFAQWLQSLGLDEEHPDPAALDQAAQDIENLVDAWKHALALGRHTTWETLAEVLALHFEIHARYREGSDVLALCAAPDAAAPALQRAAARVAVLRARLLHWAENDAADRLAEAALQVFETLDDDGGRIAAWRVRGVIAWRRGAIDTAVQIFQRALALCDRSGHDGKRAMLLDGLGLALVHRGEQDASRRAFEAALALNEARGNSLQRVHNLINLALDMRVRTPPHAMALARRALALAEQIRYEHYVPHCLTTQALALLAAGQPLEGRQAAARAAALTRQSGDTYVESWSLAALARGCLQDGLLAEAAASLARGLELSWGEHDLGLVTQHLSLAARWYAACGRPAQAAALVQALIAQPATPSWLRQELQALPQPGPAAAGGPQCATPPGSLAVLVHQTLGDLSASPG